MQKAVTFASLSTAAMQLSAQAILESADIYLVLWPDGQIAEARVDGKEQAELDLVGQPIARIARSTDSKALVKLVSQTRSGQPTAPIEVQHAYGLPEGTSARYSAHLAGDGINVVLIGTWLSKPTSPTEQTVEEEIARIQAQNRERTEARYRLLFESSSEGVFFVDPDTGQVEEANANAAILFDIAPHDLVGAFFSGLFRESSSTNLISRLLATGAETNPTRTEVTLRHSGRRMSLSGRLVRTLERKLIMVRVTRSVADNESDVAPEESAAISLLRNSAVPIVIGDRSGTTRWVNDAFHSVKPRRTAIGRQIVDVLGISDSLLEVTLREVDVQGRALTSLGLLGGDRTIAQDAHVTIVALPEAEPIGYGFAVRFLREDGIADNHAATPDDSAIADLVGKAPLKYLVRESTDVIERNCIEAALSLTDNNRAAAAQALGLSRQTLYAKLKQYDLS